MKILVSGASGLIGSALTEQLRSSGHEVATLVRRPPRSPAEHRWDPAAGELSPEALEGAEAVVNLSGAGIGDKRWTDGYKDELRRSRIDSTALIARSIAESADPPAVLLSGSAVGWYGDRGDEKLTEGSPPGSGFLADLCKQWEAATAPASDRGTRVVHLRTGIVLSARGGALAKQLPLFRFGLGGRFGSGAQWSSWISIDDHVAATAHLLTTDVEGAVNLTAPNPVTNRTFADTLGDVLHRPTVLTVPRFGPDLVLGRERADALLYTGQRVLPERLADDGFQFAHPTLDAALRAVLAPTVSEVVA